MTGRRKLLVNSLSLLLTRLTQSITAFMLVAAIARLLGPYELGQYTLAFSYYYVFVNIASQGLKILFTREISRNSNPLETPVYLASGTLLQLFVSLASYGVLVITVFALPYNSGTSTVCYVMGLMIVPFALSNITEAIFQAQERMYLIAYSTVPVYILRVLVMIWAMKLGYSVNLLATIMVISEVLILLVEWSLITQTIKPKWQINWGFIWHTLISARTFMGVEAMAAINNRTQVVILSVLGGEVTVGLFSSIIQLMQPFHIVSQSLVVSVFPGLSKAATLGREKQSHMAGALVELLLSIALPFNIGLLFFGHDLLLFVYGDPSFTDVGMALSIVAFALIASSFNRPLSMVLLANNLERFNLIEVTITTVIGSVLSLLLVSRYQATGAAIAILLIVIAALVQYMYAVYTHLFSLQLWQILRRPLLISLFMLPIFLILEKTTQDFLFTMVVISFSYGLLVVVLAINEFGGLRSVCNKLFHIK